MSFAAYYSESGVSFATNPALAELLRREVELDSAGIDTVSFKPTGETTFTPAPVNSDGFTAAELSAQAHQCLTTAARYRAAADRLDLFARAPVATAAADWTSAVAADATLCDPTRALATAAVDPAADWAGQLTNPLLYDALLQTVGQVSIEC